MAKIPLTIDKHYCADWGVYEGVRELIQNAKDAEDDGYPMLVEHFPRTNRLEITSKKVYVDPGKLLVLGKSDKAPGQRRGQFGEGFVLGCLALARKGHNVGFRNGELSWSISFEEPDPGHPLAGNELMTFRSRALSAREADFCVEVSDISTAAWDILKTLFLFITPAGESFSTPDATLLLDPAHKGKVYSRGIFVREFPNLACGYDLMNLKLDRDRRFVDEWDLHYRLGQVWKEACDKDPAVAAPRIYEMAKAATPEGRSVKYHADEKLLRAVRARFEAEHGPSATPVASMADAKAIEEAGGTPTMVSSALQELLEKSGLTVEAARQSLEGQVEARFVPGQLDDDERMMLEHLLDIVPEFSVVRFKGETPACRLIDNDTLVGLDRRLLKQPLAKVLKCLLLMEAKRRKVDPLDVLLERIDAAYPPSDAKAAS